MDVTRLKGSETMIEDVYRKSTMTDAARAAQNAYKREWNARNPDKNKEYQRRYWAKKAKEMDLTRQETAGKDVATNGIVNEAD